MLWATRLLAQPQLDSCGNWPVAIPPCFPRPRTWWKTEEIKILTPSLLYVHLGIFISPGCWTKPPRPQCRATAGGRDVNEIESCGAHGRDNTEGQSTRDITSVDFSPRDDAGETTPRTSHLRHRPGQLSQRQRRTEHSNCALPLASLACSAAGIAREPPK